MCDTKNRSINIIGPNNLYYNVFFSKDLDRVGDGKNWGK